MKSLAQRLTLAYKVASRAIKSYATDNGSLAAAAVSFYACLSILPLGILVAMVATFLLGSPEQARDALLHVVGEYYPAGVQGAGVQRIIDQIVDGRAAVTGVSSLLLLWSGISLMHVIARAVNVAWDIETQRGVLAQRAIDFALLLIGIASLGLSLGMTATIEVIRSMRVHLFGLSAQDFSPVWNVLSYFVPLAVTILAFTVFYKIAPNDRVPIRIALIGGVCAGIMWELSKVAFGYYVSHFAATSSIYGPLGGLVLIPVWINYSSSVAILGAEIASESKKIAEEKRRV